jgi:N-acetylglutamate synthase-like GNAT family acetyltransferase
MISPYSRFEDQTDPQTRPSADIDWQSGAADRVCPIPGPQFHLTATGSSASLHNRIDAPAGDCDVRSFREQDAAAVTILGQAGVLPGYVGIDFGDLHNIAAAYLANDRNHFWVAEHRSQIVGAVGLAEVCRNVGQLRWLRIAPEWQENHHVEQSLLRVATTFAHDVGLLKLILHAPRRLQPEMIDFLHLLGFAYSRNTTRDGRDTMEFYLNIYRRLDRGAKPRPSGTRPRFEESI